MPIASTSSHSPRPFAALCNKLLWLSAFLFFTNTPQQAIASDYAREARFADDIRAQLVVGDAVMLPLALAAGAPATGRPFLGITQQASRACQPSCWRMAWVPIQKMV